MSVELLPREEGVKFLKRALTEQKDGSVTANCKLEIYLPKKFVDNGMASVTDTVTTAAVLGLVIPGECYAPLVALMDITLLPFNIRESNVKGVQYFVLEFEEGDTVIENVDVIQDSNKPYSYSQEFYDYARVSWYLSEKEIMGLFDNARAECGSNVGSTRQVTRVLTSTMFRDPDEPSRAYRYSEAMRKGLPPLIMGLNNGPMLIDGTFAKITGGYLRDNTLAAMVTPDTKVTDNERIIRGIPT